MTESRLRGFTVLTRCQTVEEFIDQFHDRTGTHHAYPRTLFVHTVDARVVGTECGFAVLLANKKPVLAGTCVVLDVYRDANNPYKRPGMRLGVKRLGPDSESVFTALEAARELRAQPDTFVDASPLPPPSGRAPVVPIASAVPIAIPRRETVPLRVMSTTDGTVELVTPRRTEKLGSRDLLMPKRPVQARTATVQIPVVKAQPPREELARTPRATSNPETAKAPEPPKREIPKHVSAEGSAVTRTTPTELRTPGSSFILPANPLTDVDDASLEGLVDGWGEKKSRVAPLQPAVVEPAIVKPVVVEAAAAETAVLEPEDVAYIVEARVVDVPPALPAAVPIVAPVPASIVVAPVIPRPLPARPSAPSSLRRPLAIVAAVVVAAAVIAFSLRGGESVAHGPSIAVESEEDVALGVRATAELDPLPPAPAVPQPTGPLKIHAVLVKTYPNGALVTVNGRSFGTTPTYVKVPANVPVELHVTRAGFRPLVHAMTSKTTIDRVFLTLRRR